MSDDLLWNLLAGEGGVVPLGPVVASDGGPDATKRHRIAWRPVHVLALIVFGLCFDAIARADTMGIGMSIALSVAGLGQLADRETRSRTRLALVGSAVALAWCLALRSSAWIGAPTFLMSVTLLSVASTGSREFAVRRLRDVMRSALRVLAGPVALWDDSRGRVGPWLGKAKRHSRSTAGVIRGVVLAVPVLALLGALLSSGDKVFADSLAFRAPGVGPVAGHVALFSVGALTLAMFLAASARPVAIVIPREDRSRIGTIEVLMILLSVSALYILFGIVQVIAIIGGDAHVRTTTGLTYAEYARSGFFQLLAVSVLTLFVLGLTRYAVGTTLRVRRSVAAASELVVLLTLGIVAVAFRRMSLYESAYGFTMRRLLPHIVIAVLGVVFTMLAVAYAGDLRRSTVRVVSEEPAVSRTATWLVSSSIAVAVVAMFGVNVVNLEAVVARSQLARVAKGESVAAQEIRGLGPDAVPSVVAWLRTHPVAAASNPADTGPAVASRTVTFATLAEELDAVRTWACSTRPRSGWAAYTLSWRNAERAANRC